MNPSPRELTNAVLACLFAALISIGAFIAIPVPGTPVPIVLQNMFIMLGAMVLGPWWGLLATGIYLFFGAIGMPVFSGGSGGLAALLGPTGGYLIGYLPATFLIGFISRKGRKRVPILMLAGIAGMVLVYAAGVARLKAVLHVDWPRAFAVGLVPFIPGDIIKTVLAAFAAPRLATGIDSLSGREGDA